MLCLLHEGVWFERQRCEQAEGRYQTVLAERHGRLKIEGHAIGAKSPLSSEISAHMSRIGQTLETQPDSRKSALELKVASLEEKNEDLQSNVARLEQRVQELEGQLGASSRQQAPPQPNDSDEDDDIDLFGEDSEETTAAAEKLKQERLAQYAERKAGKKKVIAKSNLIIEVKPWSDETDVGEMEKCVRTVTADGLLWGSSKLVPVAYGIKKLQISCVIEDDKIGTDFLEEQITAFDEFVQSMDVVAFNKV